MTDTNILGSNFNPEEKNAPHSSGMVMLFLNSLLVLIGIGVFIFAFVWGFNQETQPVLLICFLSIVSGLYSFIIGPIIYGGLKVLRPSEAYVLTLFGKYYGTLKGPGFFFVNPFVIASSPAKNQTSSGSMGSEKQQPTTYTALMASSHNYQFVNKKISLKAMTLNNDKQKVNDSLGNPIIIGIVVVWRVVNTAKAIFNVDSYTEYLSIQCDSALRNIVRLYPYDASDELGEKSLRGSSQEIADSLKKEIQEKVDIAGLEIIEARITHLSYAPEIAAAMLQRQQASAIIAARQMIVDGAVGMVEMALARLSKNNVVQLDEERKAAMVSNLLVVLCGNKEAQPIVNTGTIY